MGNEAEAGAKRAQETEDTRALLRERLDGGGQIAGLHGGLTMKTQKLSQSSQKIQQQMRGFLRAVTDYELRTVGGVTQKQIERALKDGTLTRWANKELVLTAWHWQDESTGESK